MDELVEKIAAVIGEALDDHELDPRYYARAVLACIEAEGMVLVPREPTSDMIMAGASAKPVANRMNTLTAAGVWAAMLAATPKPPNPSATPR